MSVDVGFWGWFKFHLVMDAQGSDPPCWATCRPPTRSTRPGVRRIRTTCATRWHDPARGWMLLPEGTWGVLIDDAALERLSPALRDEARALKRRRIKRRDPGQLVWLRGRIRWLARHDFRLEGRP